MDWKLEVVVLPVADVDRAKAFYAEQAGFIVDLDTRIGEDVRIVQLTPRGSGCSVVVGRGIGEAAPGSAPALQLVVSDIDAARAELAGRGVAVSAVQHQQDGTWVEGKGGDWNSFVFFSDPDGNSWTVQERPAGPRRSEQDPVEVARAIIDGNLYMTLATADADGRPWAAPVFYAPGGYTDFYWMSVPDATHSRNLAQRPQLSVVIFDSTVPPNTGQAVYMSAAAEELTGDDIDRGLEVFPGSAERGARDVTRDDVEAPSPWRLYRARALEQFVGCPRDPGRPCARHDLAIDHRTAVAP
jgi:catechol 2,3-dioxygenase-like lactoylglutathione lyase family enzyme